MLKTIRRSLWCMPVLAVFSVMTMAAAVRADEPPLTQDVNAFWQAMAAPGPPSAPDPLKDDVNTYWRKVQLQQDYQQLHQRNQ